MAHIRQSWPDSGPRFQTKVLKTLEGIPSSLESGGGYLRRRRDLGYGWLSLARDEATT